LGFVTKFFNFNNYVSSIVYFTMAALYPTRVSIIREAVPAQRSRIAINRRVFRILLLIALTSRRTRTNDLRTLITSYSHIITIYLHYLSIIAGNRYRCEEAWVWLGVNEKKKKPIREIYYILPIVIIIILPTIMCNNTEYVLQTKSRTTVYDVYMRSAHTYVI